MAYTTIQATPKDVFGIAVSRGCLVNRIKQVSETLKGSYEEPVKQLPEAEHVPADESGWKESRKPEWVWVLRTQPVRVFKIAGSRGRGELALLLGKAYGGIVSCDLWGAGKIAPKVVLRFCRVHVIRDLLFWAGQEDTTVVAYGNRVLKAVKQMYTTIPGREGMTRMRWKRRMNKHRKERDRAATFSVPKQKDVLHLSERMQEWGGS
jgi:hypothetical protein